jgi:hypothetical protein
MNNKERITELIVGLKAKSFEDFLTLVQERKARKVRVEPICYLATPILVMMKTNKENYRYSTKFSSNAMDSGADIIFVETYGIFPRQEGKNLEGLKTVATSEERAKEISKKFPSLEIEGPRKILDEAVFTDIENLHIVPFLKRKPANLPRFRKLHR